MSRGLIRQSSPQSRGVCTGEGSTDLLFSFSSSSHKWPSWTCSQSCCIPGVGPQEVSIPERLGIMLLRSNLDLVQTIGQAWSRSQDVQNWSWVEMLQKYKLSRDVASWMIQRRKAVSPLKKLRDVRYNPTDSYFKSNSPMPRPVTSDVVDPHTILCSNKLRCKLYKTVIRHVSCLKMRQINLSCLHLRPTYCR
jgi:hypothetical protein